MRFLIALIFVVHFCNVFSGFENSTIKVLNSYERQLSEPSVARVENLYFFPKNKMFAINLTKDIHLLNDFRYQKGCYKFINLNQNKEFSKKCKKTKLSSVSYKKTLILDFTNMENQSHGSKVL